MRLGRKCDELSNKHWNSQWAQSLQYLAYLTHGKGESTETAAYYLYANAFRHLLVIIQSLGKMFY